jgi:hypothetical protein
MRFHQNVKSGKKVDELRRVMLTNHYLCKGIRRDSQSTLDMNEVEEKLVSFLLHLGERISSTMENSIEAVSKIVDGDYLSHKDLIVRVLVAW